MARVKTFTNNGSLLPGDINAIQDDYEKAFTRYSVLVERGAQMGANAGTYVFGTIVDTLNSVAAPGLMCVGLWSFHLVGADYAASPRTTRLRVRASCLVNAVAPANNYTIGLYPVASFGGASTQGPFINSLGGVVTGSTVQFTAPPASTQTHGNSTDFAFPADGHYALAVSVSGSINANSLVTSRVQLQVRQT